MALQNIFLLSAFGGLAVASPILDTLSDRADFVLAFWQPNLGEIEADPRTRLGAPINAMIDPVLLLIGAAVASLSWGIWRHKSKQRQAVLDSAWREVLADPRYLERRHLEERRIIKDAGRHGAAR